MPTGDLVTEIVLRAMRLQAWRVVYVQAVVALIVSSLLGLGFGLRAGWSALLAGGICVLANSYYVYRVFRTTGAHQVERVVQGFYRGEVAKLVVSIVLFYAAFTYVDLSPLPFFGCYVITQLAYGCAMFVFKPTRRV